MGRLRGDLPGPTLICIGGLHGNEPAGVLGLARVLQLLETRAPALRGELVALAGNRAALAAGRRFVDRDLNRAWADERLDRFRVRGHPPEVVEDREQVELLGAIESAVAEARGPVFVLDLHTTSGLGGPFTSFGDTLPNRALASPIPVPMILGLDELLDSSLTAFLGRHGLVAVAFESGQHEEPRAVDRAEAGILVTVASVGLLPEALLPEAAAARALLSGDTAHLPHALEMVHRHPIAPADGFVMDPGFRNFQPVRRGQEVATDVRGRVRVDRDARILMPLYQKLGEDGYFLVREFGAFWLRASWALRRLGADRFVHWLPGVKRDPAVPDGVVVDRRIARWRAAQLLHLLGFRRVEGHGTRLVLRRRVLADARYRVPGAASRG
jgi:succinylglutamate desuccinylase